MSAMATGEVEILDGDPKLELETRAVAIRRQLEAVVITDHPSYLAAAELLKSAAAMRQKIQEFFRPMKEAAFKSHRAICDQESKMLDEVVYTERKARTAISSYEVEQERARQELIRRAQEEERKRAEAEAARIAKENERLREEARRQHDDDLLQMAAQIERDGATKEQVEEVLSIPMAEPAVVQYSPMIPVAPPIPEFQRAAGLSKPRDNWSAEITNLQELIVFCAGNPQYQGLLEPNLSALNSQARSLKDKLRIPGVRAKNTPNIGVRTK